MNAGWACIAAAWLLGLGLTVNAQAGERLVFGSFAQHANAAAFAEKLSHELDHKIVVATVSASTGEDLALTMHRVVTAAAADGSLAELQKRAIARGHRPWYWRLQTSPSSSSDPASSDAPQPEPAMPQPESSVVRLSKKAQSATNVSEDRSPAEQGPSTARSAVTELDLSLQSRTYAYTGLHNQSRWQLSASGQFDWYRAWADSRHSLTVSPFFRIDGEDDERSHVDLREGFYSYIGDTHEVHVGARQIFWGVTEFKHLVDVINQTDLVENIDGEDKLGQPMIQLSTTRDWGIVSLFVLTGTRERTFAGTNGRLRFALPIDDDAARFESSAGRGRVDGAIRWSHYAGPLSWGLYHFSGTNRDPLLQPRQSPSGELELVPYYSVIDQTGLDAQLLVADWAFKLEAITRSGDGDRYAAANLGFERTLVGVLGSRSDLGLVVEYMFDERGDEAHNTLFERDVAVGTRFSLNDTAGTQALLGVIWDSKTHETVVSLEASRQIGSHWQLAIEGRVFSGAPKLDASEQLLAFDDGSAKSSFLQNDDFLQLELTRYF